VVLVVEAALVVHLLLLLLLLLRLAVPLLLLQRRHPQRQALLPAHPSTHPSDHLLLQSPSGGSTRACSPACRAP
jgi:hypothetical protein